MATGNHGSGAGTLGDESSTLKLVLLSGRSGSGKSSTAFEICHLLRRSKIPHVHIDGDNLDAFYPRDDNSELMLRNLESMWTVYWAQVQEVLKSSAPPKKRFIVVLSGTGMVLQSRHIASVLTRVMANGRYNPDVLGGVDFQVYPIVLHANEEAVEARLKRREIGGELDEHLESSGSMNRILSNLNDRQIRMIRSDGDRNVTHVAREVLDHIKISLVE